jgi:hypothetical protein
MKIVAVISIYRFDLLLYNLLLFFMDLSSWLSISISKNSVYILCLSYMVKVVIQIYYENLL